MPETEPSRAAPENNAGDAAPKSKNDDLHGSAPDDSPVALVLIDVINDMEFPGGEDLLEYALPMAKRIAELKSRAKQLGIPVIYANDNYGRWQSDFRRLVEHCLEDGVRGRPIAELLAPDEDDYFVLKPKHSAFFSTTFETLLDHLGIRSLILTGVAGNICVLFTASDAYMRDFEIYVPSDCMASETEELNRQALSQLETILDADTTPSVELDVEALVGRTPPS